MMKKENHNPYLYIQIQWNLTGKLQELKKTDIYLFNLISEVPKIDSLQPITSNIQDKNANPDLTYI
jgi:hypothetical protein